MGEDTVTFPKQEIAFVRLQDVYKRQIQGHLHRLTAGGGPRLGIDLMVMPAAAAADKGDRGLQLGQVMIGVHNDLLPAGNGAGRAAHTLVAVSYTHLTLAIHRGQALGILRLEDKGTNDRMGADGGAPVALGAVLRMPHGDIHRDAALFKGGRAGGHFASDIGQESGDRQRVALQVVGGNQDIADIGVLLGVDGCLLYTS